MRVMLVEDNAADVSLVRALLDEVESADLELVEAGLVSEAEHLLQSEPFDAVLLDLTLPDSCGLESLSRVQRIAPHVPVVVLSGLTDESLALEAVRNGAQDYLLKGGCDGAALARAVRYSAERKRAELEVRHSAQHDSLTGLPNRMLLMDRLGQALALARRERKLLALLFIDLDNFKTINDTKGHPVGDALLRSIATRLAACVRESDTVARMGGDEFTIVLPRIAHVEDIVRFVSKLLDRFRRPFQINDQAEYTSASVGISVHPVDGDTPEALIEAADAAMYRAKQGGGDGYQFHSSASSLKTSESLPLGNRLRLALSAGELRLHYQPRVDGQSGTMVGMEALVRWDHPTLGLLPPARFVPMAEEIGLIVPIGDWVLRRACEEAQRWNHGRDGLPLRVSVNLSSRQFGQHSLVRTVENALRESGLPAQCLELELTESGIGLDERAAVPAIRELHDIGVRLSVDDFGMGYSSLSRLCNLPLDALKIDRSFVRGMDRPRNAALVATIVSMARSMSMTAVAEGVETVDQLLALRQMNCDEMQGFYFSAALASDEFAELLRGAPPRPPRVDES
jgi:diguanylate cyclase (GGDEF)-like protein